MRFLEKPCDFDTIRAMVRHIGVGIHTHRLLEQLAQRAEENRRLYDELRAIFAERFPELDRAAVAHACQMSLAFVQVPPRGLWGRRAQVRSTTVEAWLGRPFVADPSIDSVVLRYLAAFGPASVADVTTWCRLTGLRAVVERLRPRLVTFRDELVMPRFAGQTTEPWSVVGRVTAVGTRS